VIREREPFWPISFLQRKGEILGGEGHSVFWFWNESTRSSKLACVYVCVCVHACVCVCVLERERETLALRFVISCRLLRRSMLSSVCFSSVCRALTLRIILESQLYSHFTQQIR